MYIKRLFLLQSPACSAYRLGALPDFTPRSCFLDDLEACTKAVLFVAGAASSLQS